MQYLIDWRNPEVVSVTARVPVGKKYSPVTVTAMKMDDERQAARGAMLECIETVHEWFPSPRRPVGKGGTE